MSFPSCGFRDCGGDYRKEADLEDSSLKLYAHQQELPRLPIPSLASTAALYLRSVAPLVSPKEYAVTKNNVMMFMKKEGPLLQQRLQSRANDREDSSYLAEWWNILGYLSVRDPVVFNVSYFLHFTDVINQRNHQTTRAACLLFATISFRTKVVSGDLEPERIGKGKTPLCATPYKYMFNACRIPRKDKDIVRIYDPKKYNHVVVMRHNKFFTFELELDLSVSSLQMQLDRIMKMAGPKESAIGALSSMNRDDWASARCQLIQDGNEEVLHRIESGVVMICLDDTSPTSKSDVSRALWHGDGKNRFYDKSIQLIIFENGKAGLLGEHSMMDGMPMVRYVDAILRDCQNINTHDKMKTLSPPVQCQFIFSTSTLNSIIKAQEGFDKTVSNHQVHVESFYGYGSKEIKRWKCSPDAFVQMAIQLAYYICFGTIKATYEASQTRPFLHGRTETTRSVSPDSAAFVAAMVQPTVSSSIKIQLLRSAVAAHVAYMKKAAKAEGVDRHLMALSLCRDTTSESESDLFSDPSYSISKTWYISTSHLTHPLLDGWGWGEVIPDGVGIAYSIHENHIQFNIACVARNWAGPLGHCLEESLLQMQSILEEEKLSKL